MRNVYVWGVPDNIKFALFRGPIGDWLKEEGIPAQRSARYRGWFVRTERSGDVIARAEHAGFRVVMKGALR